MKKWKGKLYEACESGETQLVQFLLQRHDTEEMNSELNKYGRNAFMCACRFGHKDIVKLLLDHSEPKIHMYAKNKSALFYACMNGHIDVVNLLLYHSKSKIDLKARKTYFRPRRGCMFYGTYDRRTVGETALMEACVEGHKDVVKLLLEHSDPRIDLKARDIYGRTALFIANVYGNQDIVQLIEAKLYRRSMRLSKKEPK